MLFILIYMITSIILLIIVFYSKTTLACRIVRSIRRRFPINENSLDLAEESMRCCSTPLAPRVSADIHAIGSSVRRSCRPSAPQPKGISSSICRPWPRHVCDLFTDSHLDRRRRTGLFIVTRRGRVLLHATSNQVIIPPI